MTKLYLLSWLSFNKINYEQKDNKDTYRNWRWLVAFDNFKVYLLRCNRFLLINNDDEGEMIGFTYAKTKEDLIKKLEGYYGR